MGDRGLTGGGFQRRHFDHYFRTRAIEKFAYGRYGGTEYGLEWKTSLIEGAAVACCMNGDDTKWECGALPLQEPRKRLSYIPVADQCKSHAQFTGAFATFLHHRSDDKALPPLVRGHRKLLADTAGNKPPGHLSTQ